MITGDNPLTAVHVARDVEIIDRDALILDLKENPKHDAGGLGRMTYYLLLMLRLDLVWHTVDESKIHTRRSFGASRPVTF